MSIALFIGAFVLTLASGLRSLGLGFVSLFVVGYFSGLIRANVLSPWTTLMFDSATLGLYVAFILERRKYRDSASLVTLRRFLLLLCGWPLLVAFIPVNDQLVQLVAFRAAAWFLPVIYVSTFVKHRELTTIGIGLALLNLMALGFAAYCYKNGVESLFPKNAVTEIIYKSRDIAGEHHRIPACFLSAHAYAGSMLFSLPLVLQLGLSSSVGRSRRCLGLLGAAAAALGLVIAGPRQPVVSALIAAILFISVNGWNPKLISGVFLTIVALVGIASTNERFQRAFTVFDAEVLVGRFNVSINTGFWNLFFEYPMGAGMGSAVGTSLPYFLMSKAPKPIGLENDYCRILIDQGWIGLGLWFAFVYWLVMRLPAQRRRSKPMSTAITLGYAISFVSWATAFIGCGTLTAIPGTCMHFLLMGVFIRDHYAMHIPTYESSVNQGHKIQGRRSVASGPAITSNLIGSPNL